ncbi:MAG: hypothetical protein HYS25_01215 [Ignavibacteriales bacterium]|nr:hypothetical protein [Ignavibacteriales bacterium]
MPRFIREEIALKAQEWSLNQERVFSEELMNKRINFFLIFFILLLVAAFFIKEKEIVSFILAAGTVITWILSFSIFSITRKVNRIIKMLKRETGHPLSSLDTKSFDLINRFLIGYALPVFCSVIITIGSALSVSGALNLYMPFKEEVTRKTEQIKEDVKKSLPKTKEKSRPSKYFQPIDSVSK